MKKDFSPEERLLRLIKGSKKKEEAKEKIFPQAAAAASPGQDKALPKNSAGRASLQFRLSVINMRALNHVFTFILAALLVYFVFDLVRASYFKDGPRIFNEALKTPAAESKEKSFEIPPYSSFSSATKGRNIFLPQQVEEEENVITGPSVEEISSELSLIGIIAGDRPQAIIEEKKSRKSYFLYEGGSIGKSKIVKISEDKVIMDYQGESFELVL